MPSSPSTRLRLEEQATGENLNTWGTKAVTAFLRLIEEAVAGVTSVTVSGPVTLTATNYVADQARRMVLNCTGTGGTVTIPSVEKTYDVRNATSGDVIISAGATSVTIPSGNSQRVWTDGTTVYAMQRTNWLGVAWTFSDPSAAQNPATKAYTDAGDATTLASANAFTTATAFTANAGVLPGQGGNSGKLLGTNGTTASWVDGVPSQTGNNGKLLGTNGTTASWVEGLPSQTGNADLVLTTNGTVSRWDIGTDPTAVMFFGG